MPKDTNNGIEMGKAIAKIETLDKMCNRLHKKIFGNGEKGYDLTILNTDNTVKHLSERIDAFITEQSKHNDNFITFMQSAQTDKQDADAKLASVIAKQKSCIKARQKTAIWWGTDIKFWLNFLLAAITLFVLLYTSYTAVKNTQPRRKQAPAPCVQATAVEVEETTNTCYPPGHQPAVE
jgi:large-conductance mechanosensitive channel